MTVSGAIRAGALTAAAYSPSLCCIPELRQLVPQARGKRGAHRWLRSTREPSRPALRLQP